MEQAWFAMAVGAGLVFGFLIAWISLRSDRATIYARGKADAEKERSSLEERILAKDSRLNELQQAAQRDREVVEQLRDENANLRAMRVEYDARLADVRHQAEEKLALVNESQQRLADTLRATLTEKIDEQEARVHAAMNEAIKARQEAETLRAEKATWLDSASGGIAPSVLAEREAQLNTLFIEAQKLRQEADSLKAEKSALEATSVRPELLAEREAQLATLFDEAQRIRLEADALKTEKVELAAALEAARNAAPVGVAPELLAEREAQLATLFAEAQQIRQEADQLKIEKAQLAASLESAQNAVMPAPAVAGVAPELLAERDAQVATLFGEAQQLRQEADQLKAALEAAQNAAVNQVLPPVGIAPELLAGREAELAAALAGVEALKAENQQLSAAPAALSVEIESLKAQNSQLMASLDAALQNAQQPIAQLEAQLAAAAAEAEALKAEKSQWTPGISAETLAGVQAQLAAAVAEVEALKAEKSQSGTENQAQLAQLQLALDQARQESESLRSAQSAAFAAHEAQLAAAQAELAEARGQAETLRGLNTESLAQQETQLAALRAEAEAARRESDGIRAERLAWIAPEVLAERESQLNTALDQAHQARQEAEVLKAEKAALLAAAIAPELLAEKEAELGKALDEAHQLHEIVEAIRMEKSAAAELAATTCAGLESKLQDALDRADAAARNAAGLSAQLEAASRDNENLRADNARLEALQIDLELRSARAEAQLDEQAQAEQLALSSLSSFAPVRARRVVEMSGLAQQSHFNEAEGDNLGDVITVSLSPTRQVSIHSLGNVKPYLESLESRSHADRSRLLSELAAAVRAHLSGLAISPGSLTVAYLPGDVLLGASLERDPRLLDFAAQRGIVVATPNSLVSLLGTVTASLRHQQMTEELQAARAATVQAQTQLTSYMASFEGLRAMFSNLMPGAMPQMPPQQQQQAAFAPPPPSASDTLPAALTALNQNVVMMPSPAPAAEPVSAGPASSNNGHGLD